MKTMTVFDCIVSLISDGNYGSGENADGEDDASKLPLNIFLAPGRCSPQFHPMKR
jgi:hypothetical protein